MFRKQPSRLHVRRLIRRRAMLRLEVPTTENLWPVLAEISKLSAKIDRVHIIATR